MLPVVCKIRYKKKIGKIWCLSKVITIFPSVRISGGSSAPFSLYMITVIIFYRHVIYQSVAYDLLNLLHKENWENIKSVKRYSRFPGANADFTVWSP